MKQWESQEQENQNSFMKNVAKLNYQNLKLIQESEQSFYYKHTLTTTTTTKSCCSNSIIDGQYIQKTYKKVITEDQLSSYSCSKRSLKGSDIASLKGDKYIRCSNLSDISSVVEQQELTVPFDRGLSALAFANNCRCYSKKGPSSIASQQTTVSKCVPNIT